MQRTTKPLGIDWEQIEALLKQGWTPRDIAVRLGCSPQNVYKRIQRYRSEIEAAPAMNGDRASGQPVGRR